jgi:mRNA-degrading endonuclease RelE of RelBE toxin-antitoxin system
MLENIFPVMSKQSAFRKGIKTNNESVTRRRVMGFKLIVYVKVGTLTLFILEMFLPQGNT